MKHEDDIDGLDEPVFIAVPDDAAPVFPEPSVPTRTPALVEEPVEPVALPAAGVVDDNALVVSLPAATGGPVVMTHPAVAVACTAVSDAQAAYYEELGWTRDDTAANRVAIDSGGLRRPDPEPTQEP